MKMLWENSITYWTWDLIFLKKLILTITSETIRFEKQEYWQFWRQSKKTAFWKQKGFFKLKNGLLSAFFFYLKWVLLNRYE